MRNKHRLISLLALLIVLLSLFLCIEKSVRAHKDAKFMLGEFVIEVGKELSFVFVNSSSAAIDKLGISDKYRNTLKTELLKHSYHYRLKLIIDNVVYDLSNVKQLVIGVNDINGKIIVTSLHVLTNSFASRTEALLKFVITNRQINAILPWQERAVANDEIKLHQRNVLAAAMARPPKTVLLRSWLSKTTAMQVSLHGHKDHPAQVFANYYHVVSVAQRL